MRRIIQPILWETKASPEVAYEGHLIMRNVPKIPPPNAFRWAIRQAWWLIGYIDRKLRNFGGTSAEYRKLPETRVSSSPKLRGWHVGRRGEETSSPYSYSATARLNHGRGSDDQFVNFQFHHEWCHTYLCDFLAAVQRTCPCWSRHWPSPPSTRHTLVAWFHWNI